jgi:hypothetical protein
MSGLSAPWEDITARIPGDPPCEPYAWRLRCGRHTLRLTRGSDTGDTWIGFCPGLFAPRLMPRPGLEAAAADVCALVREMLRETLDELPAALSPVRPLEFTQTDDLGLRWKASALGFEFTLVGTTTLQGTDCIKHVWRSVARHGGAYVLPIEPCDTFEEARAQCDERWRTLLAPYLA